MKASLISAFAPKVLLLVLLCTAASCSKDKETAPASSSSIVELPSSVIGSFTGQLSYTGSSVITTTNGQATLTRTGDKTYSLAFSDAVPAIASLRFQSSANGAYASVGNDGSTTGMVLSATSLTIGVTKGSETWAFTGNK